MTNIRIKDIPTATPNGSEKVAFDSTSPGVRSNSITNVVDVGMQTIASPIIGAANIGEDTLVRTRLDSVGDFTAQANAILTQGVWSLNTSSFGNIVPSDVDTFYPGVRFFVSGTQGSKISGLGGIALFGGDVVISGAFFRESTAFTTIRTITTQVGVVTSSDFGKGIAFTGAGGCTASFTSALTQSYPSGRFTSVDIQVEGTTPLFLVSSSGGVTFNGTTASFQPFAGQGLIRLTTRDGLHWFK